MRVRLRPERGLDVAEAWVGDRQIAWLSGRGDLAWNGDWTASWGGGLVTTCGLDNVGAPSEGVGQHGTYSSLPAIDGVIRDPRGLRVERTIETGDGTLRLVDVTTNVADVALEAPLLYHVNLGDWARRVESDADAVVPRDEDAEPYDPSAVPPPGDVPEQRVGARRCELGARDRQRPRGRGALEPAAAVAVDRPGAGRAEVEPANCSVLGRAHDRAEGRLPFLAPGETRETWLEISAKETR